MSAHAELNSDVCFCRSHKQKGDAFCFQCWTKLSLAMRTKLAKLLKGHYSNDYEIFIHTAKAEISAHEVAYREGA